MEQIFYLPSTMLWPLVACLVLTGIHVYLGVHVIARKVIFVDLALAQIAALGTVIGVLLGYEAGKDTTALYLYSLAFTVFGAFIFSVTKMRGEKVPHEAIIGIVYAVTFAATILVISRSALGPQELDHIIKGELLWVQAPTVIKTALIYALVGTFHIVFRKQFLTISFEPAQAEARGTRVRLWDFLFYMSFGIVITSSVAIAGVFLVFSYLVIPSVAAMLLSEKISTRLAIGWIGGSVCSFIGVKLSWNTGLPTSPLVVCVLAVGLLTSATVYYVRTAQERKLAFKHLAGAVTVILVFVAGVLLFRKGEEDPLEHTMHLLESKLGTDRVTAMVNLPAFVDKKDHWIRIVIDRLRDEDVEVRKAAMDLLTKIREQSALPTILTLLGDSSEDARRSAVGAVRALGTSSDGRYLLEQASREDDPEIKLEMIRTAFEMGDPAAIPSLIRLAQDGGIFADEAYETLQGHLSMKFGRKDLKNVLDWWDLNSGKIKWNEAARVYQVSK